MPQNNDCNTRTQKSCFMFDQRCNMSFVTRANYYKDKYMMLAAIVGSSIVIIIFLVSFAMKQNSDIAILKSQMKDIKEIVINPDEIGFYSRDNKFFIKEK